MQRIEHNLTENAEAKEKLDLLYHLYGKKLLYMAGKILGNSDEAEEIVQTAFRKIICILDEIEKPKENRTFTLLNTVVQSLCLKRKGKQKWKGTVASEKNCPDDIHADPPAQTDGNRNGQDAVLQLIKDLPEKYRTPMTLYYVWKMPLKKTSELLGISQNMASIRMLKGQRMLMSKINADDDLKKEISKILQQSKKETKQTDVKSEDEEKNRPE